jgi:hypothetical protein
MSRWGPATLSIRLGEHFCIRVLLAAALPGLLFCAAPTARADDDSDRVAKVVLELPPQAQPPQLPFARPLPTASSRANGHRLAEAIAASTSKTVVERGVQNAMAALRDCQKEEGGAISLSNIPSGRPASRIDHCFRQ